MTRVGGRFLLKKLTEEHFQDAYSLVVKQMFEWDPITKVVGATMADMHHRYIPEQLRKSMDSGLSVVALDEKNNNKVVASYFINDKTLIDPYTAYPAGVFEPFAALRKDLFDMVQEKQGWILSSDKVAFSNIGAVEIVAVTNGPIKDINHSSPWRKITILSCS